jgi:hypothetical protein
MRSRPSACQSARYAVPGRVYVKFVVKRLPTVGFEGADVQKVEL